MADAKKETIRPDNFDDLRAEGIRILQRLGARRWTDFNTHDPGITLLEALCYALTDLAYRSGHSLPDLLGPAGERRLRLRYGLSGVLPGAPLTLTDLRKRLLDLPGVRDARIEAVGESDPPLFFQPYDGGLGLAPGESRSPIRLDGLFRVRIAKKPDAPADTMEAVRTTLDRCRPLAGDWLPPVAMAAQPVKVVAKIEMRPDVSFPEALAQEAFAALADFLSPEVFFRSPSASLREGLAADQVFEGPLLQNGYLPDTELGKLTDREMLHVSDLIQILMDVPGVLAVRDIFIEKNSNDHERWLLPLTAGYFPELDTQSEISLHIGSQFSIFKYDSNYRQVSDSQLPKPAETFIFSEKKERNLSHYHSIRHHLPALYGVDMPLEPTDKPARRGQIRQLGGYLLFFEQLLADAFAQVGHARQLFDFENFPENSYAVQVLRHEPEALALLALPEDKLEDFLQTAANANNAERLNRLLDHLLARFAENFGEFALLAADRPEQTVQAKHDFLREYPDFSLGRGLGAALSESESRSPLEHRIARLLGFGWPPNAWPAPHFFMIEHLLLRPIGADVGGDEEDYLLNQAPTSNPYSRRLTFVFSENSSRFTSEKVDDENYREFVRQVLRRETPAHLALDCIWLEETAMQDFAAAHTQWRKALNSIAADPMAYRVARDRVADLLKNAEKNYLLGWHRPILDLSVEVPFIVPGRTHPLVILNSQSGVRYTLCDRRGDPVAGIQTALGNGIKLEIPLPNNLTEETIFLIKARKEGENGLFSEGFLLQKIRVKVGIDKRIPVEISTPEIPFNTPASVRLTRSQAGVSYILFLTPPAANATGTPGLQDQPIELTSPNLQEDSQLRIEAKDSRGRETFPVPPAPDINIRVRPNPALAATAPQIVLDYDAVAVVEVAQPQTSANYQLQTRDLRDEEFLENSNPPVNGAWTPANLEAALLPMTAIAGLEPHPDPGVRTASKITLRTTALRENTRIAVFASKTGHAEGVFLTKKLDVLVRPNPNVAVAASSNSVQSGEKVLIRLVSPQPGVFYTLHRKGSTETLDSLYFHDTQPDGSRTDGVEKSRLEFDFFLGDTLSPPLTLTTPALTASTEFEIMAEKPHTGLKVKLNAGINIAVS